MGPDRDHLVTAPPAKWAGEAVNDRPNFPPITSAGEAVNDRPNSPPVTSVGEAVNESPNPPQVTSADESDVVTYINTEGTSIVEHVTDATGAAPVINDPELLLQLITDGQLAIINPDTTEENVTNTYCHEYIETPSSDLWSSEIDNLFLPPKEI
jgi:hypothetical protein